MSNALVTMQDMGRMAEAVAKSGLFGVKTADQAMALMLVAQAEGRHPAQAARDYDIIQGRPAKKTEAMMRDYILQGGKVEWHALDDTIADATFSHQSGGTVRITWDLKRAAAAGLAGRDMWKKYPRQMLRSRCVSEGIRTVCPLATSGMPVAEELQDSIKEKDITPTSGAEDRLITDQIERVKDIVDKARTFLIAGNVAEAVIEIDEAGFDADEMVYLWTHFDSKQRSAMKAYDKKRKAQAALPAPHPNAISEAQHKRLEARIVELKLARESVKEHVKLMYDRDHFTELTKDQYSELDAWLDTHTAPQPTPVPADPRIVGGEAAAAVPYSEQIKAAQTMDELAEVWKAIPKDDREIYLAAKDKRKAELTEGGK